MVHNCNPAFKPLMRHAALNCTNSNVWWHWEEYTAGNLQRSPASMMSSKAQPVSCHTGLDMEHHWSCVVYGGKNNLCSWLLPRAQWGVFAGLHLQAHWSNSSLRFASCTSGLPSFNDMPLPLISSTSICVLWQTPPLFEFNVCSASNCYEPACALVTLQVQPLLAAKGLALGNPHCPNAAPEQQHKPRLDAVDRWRLFASSECGRACMSVSQSLLVACIFYGSLVLCPSAHLRLCACWHLLLTSMAQPMGLHPMHVLQSLMPPATLVRREQGSQGAAPVGGS